MDDLPAPLLQRRNRPHGWALTRAPSPPPGTLGVDDHKSVWTLAAHGRGKCTGSDRLVCRNTRCGLCRLHPVNKSAKRQDGQHTKGAGRVLRESVLPSTTSKPRHRDYSLPTWTVDEVDEDTVLTGISSPASPPAAAAIFLADLVTPARKRKGRPAAATLAAAAPRVWAASQAQATRLAAAAQAAVTPPGASASQAKEGSADAAPPSGAAQGPALAAPALVGSGAAAAAAAGLGSSAEAEAPCDPPQPARAESGSVAAEEDEAGMLSAAAAPAAGAEAEVVAGSQSGAESEEWAEAEGWVMCSWCLSESSYGCMCESDGEDTLTE